MGFWALWGSVAGAAGGMDVPTAQAMVDGLVEEVERRAGRRFVRRPTVATESREQLRGRLLETSRRGELGARAGLRPPTEPSPDALRRTEYLLQNVLALYAERDETIFLVEESLDEVSTGLSLGEDVMRAALGCVLVHEMVHALQHQYGVEEADDPDRERGLAAVREGYAELIAGDYCDEVAGPAIGLLVDSLGGVELVASLRPDDEVAVYGWGRLFARELAKAELVWPAMIAPAPPWSAIAQAVGSSLPVDWRDPRALTAALERIDEDAEITAPGLASPTTLLTPFFAEGVGQVAMPRALGGFAVESTSTKRKMLLATFLLTEEGAASRLVDERRQRVEAALQTGEPVMVYAKVNGDLSRSPTIELPMTDDLRVRSSVQIAARSTGDGPYHETWLATDRRLVVLLATGGKLRGKDVSGALARLLDETSEEPTVEPSLEPLAPWIAEVRAIEPGLTELASPAYRFERAAREVASGDPRGCATVFDPLIGEDVEHDRVPYAAAAFECAAVTGDVALAQRAHALLPELEPYTAAFLAAKLVNEQRAREALAILDKADIEGTGDEELIDATRHVRVSLAVRTRNWREVTRLVEAHPDLDPQLRAYAGSALYNAGRRSDGRRILAAACPELDEAERARCEQFVGGR